MPYEAEMIAGGAVFVEPDMGPRLLECANQWGWARTSVLGNGRKFRRNKELEGNGDGYKPYWVAISIPLILRSRYRLGR